MTDDTKNIKSNFQIPPRSHAYNKLYANITECKNCGSTGFYKDHNFGYPCKYCGGEIIDAGAGKWIPPTYTGHLWWKKILKQGYWKKPKKENLSEFFLEQFHFIIQQGIRKKIANNEELASGQIAYMEKKINEEIEAQCQGDK